MYHSLPTSISDRLHDAEQSTSQLVTIWLSAIALLISQTIALELSNQIYERVGMK